MNNFWDLVGFEYKKIIKRKSFLFSLIGLLIAFVFILSLGISSPNFYHYPGGNMTKMEAMKADKAVVRKNAGEITPQLIDKAIEANQEMKLNDENYIINEYGKFLKGDAYIKYILPYQSIYQMINVIYEKDETCLSTDGAKITSINKEEAIDTLKKGEGKEFYEKLKEFMKFQLNQEYLGLSQKEIEKNYSMMDEIKYPLYNDYYGGYEFYINNAKEMAIIMLFIITVIIAPLFGEEYHKNTYPILISTRNGKSSLCKAKLFVAFSLGAAISMITMISLFLGGLFLFGFEGANVNIQVLNPSYTYPFTLLKACILHMLIVFATSITFSFFIAWLSAKAKRNTFSLETIATFILVLPMFIYISPRLSHFLYSLINLFPANAITFQYKPYLYNILGKLYLPYEFILMFSIVMTILYGIFSVYRFRKNNI